MTDRIHIYNSFIYKHNNISKQILDVFGNTQEFHILIASANSKAYNIEKKSTLAIKIMTNLDHNCFAADYMCNPSPPF